MVMLEVKSQCVFQPKRNLCSPRTSEFQKLALATNNNNQQYIAHECKESCQEGSFFYPLKNQSLTLNRRAGWEVGIVKKAISCHLQ